MAHETTPWKVPNCSLSLVVSQFSKREPHSSEINEKYGEGGGLNANYTAVEAVATVANLLGRAGMRYGIDFVWKTISGDTLELDFAHKDARDVAERILSEERNRPPNAQSSIPIRPDSYIYTRPGW